MNSTSCPNIEDIENGNFENIRKEFLGVNGKIRLKIIERMKDEKKDCSWIMHRCIWLFNYKKNELLKNAKRGNLVISTTESSWR